MPLNVKFRNLGRNGLILAVLINMLLVGFWHGATWNFVLFGLYNGVLFIPLILSGSIFKKDKLVTNKYGLASIKDYSKMFVTFMLITIGLIACRGEDIGHVFNYVVGIFNVSIFSVPHGIEKAINPLIFSVLLFIIEWYSREIEFPLQTLNIPTFIRWNIYILIIFLIIIMGSSGEHQFIYFQF